MGGMGGRRTPVVGDLALHPVEIESRLRDVTVYTLLDQQNQFILVSGSDSGKEGATTKSLGLFFLNKEDADAVLSRLAKDDPTMVRAHAFLPSAPYSSNPRTPSLSLIPLSHTKYKP